MVVDSFRGNARASVGRCAPDHQEEERSQMAGNIEARVIYNNAAGTAFVAFITWENE